MSRDRMIQHAAKRAADKIKAAHDKGHDLSARLIALIIEQAIREVSGD